MTKEFHYMVFMVTHDHGHTRYHRTSVEYGHDGIKNLTHYVPLPQNGFLFTAGVGSPSGAYRFDGGDGRTPLRSTGHASASEAHLYQRFQLPTDFGTWPTDPFEISVYRSDNLASAINVSWIGPTGDVDAGMSSVTIRPASAGVWQRFSIPAPSGAYARGAFATLRVIVVFDAAAGSSFVEVADWCMRYKSARGNVVY